MSQKQFISLFFLCLLAMGLLHSGCNRYRNPILPHTERIFPLTEGKYKVYSVIDTTYNTQATLIDTFFRKEWNKGIQEDLLGREAHRLETYRAEYAAPTTFVQD